MISTNYQRSPKYNNQANCQFPRDIRKEGQKYKVPAVDISVASGQRGTFFYRVKKDRIEIISENQPIQKPDKIYESAECSICLSNPCDIVFAPCGHLTICERCNPYIKVKDRCPICRADIENKIHKDKFN